MSLYPERDVQVFEEGCPDNQSGVPLSVPYILSKGVSPYHFSKSNRAVLMRFFDNINYSASAVRRVIVDTQTARTRT